MGNVEELDQREMEKDISNLYTIHPFLCFHPIRGVHRRIKARLDELTKALMLQTLAEARRQKETTTQQKLEENARQASKEDACRFRELVKAHQEAERNHNLKRGALLPRFYSFTEAQGPPPEDVNGFF